MHDRGVETVVVDRDPSAIAFELASRRAIVSTEDEPAVERLARAEGVAGIVSPGADWTVGVGARIAERLGLPHPIDAATATLATNKQRQRAALAAAGVPQPASRVVSGPEDGLPVPCVVKAPDRQGQRGLALVRRREELPRAIDAAMRASRNATALVEELVEGPEVTVNAVSIDGRFVPLTVTDRITAEPPAFGVALAHAWPSEHDGAGAVESAAAAAAALGIRNGPTYTQLRLGADGPRVVEVAARLGGGHDAELCRAALGVDLNGLALAFALGEAVSVPETAQEAFGRGLRSASSCRPKGSWSTFTGSRTHAGGTACWTCSSIVGAGMSSGRSASAPTGPVRSSLLATAATTPWSGRGGRPSACGSRSRAPPPERQRRVTVSDTVTAG